MNQHERELQHYLENRAGDIENEAIAKGLLNPNLRYGRNRITASNLADEYYCEQFLDLKEKYKQKPIEILKEEVKEETLKLIDNFKDKAETGTTIHLAAKIESTHITEQILRCLYKDVLLVAVPDEITFDGTIITITEIKSKELYSRKPYDETQIRMSAYCLQEMISTHQQYSIITTYNLIIRYNSQEFTFPYSRDKFLSEIEFAIPFWKNERQAIPTKLAFKCRGCPYKEECPYNS